MSESHPDPAGTGIDLVVEGLRAIGQDRSVRAVMELTTTAALATVTAAGDAGVTVPRTGGFATLAASSHVPIAVDALQYEHGGPSLQVIDNVSVICCDDLRTERRWPAFAQGAVEQTPVLSMLSCRLYVHRDEPIGALNMYAGTPHAFSADAVTAAQRLAAYVAVALAHAKAREKVANLERAVNSNRDIGAAIGILMIRRLVTRDQAFELLRTASQHQHRKLHDVADDVLQAGDLISDAPNGWAGPQTRRPARI